MWEGYIMSKIKNLKHFKSLRTLSIQSSKEINSRCFGLYDPVLSEELYGNNNVYEEGSCTFYPILGNRKVILYDDDYLIGKPCLWLCFKHYLLGDGFVSKKISKGHWHAKCLVSSTEVSILESMNKDKKGNLLFTGELLEGIPFKHKLIDFSLYVIKGEKSRLRVDDLKID
mgnify:CR=1 FL=1